MPNHQEDLLVPYTPEEMFDLVVDVERYPEFVPGYREARIDRREGNRLFAVQRVGIGAATVQFHSAATIDRPRSIHIRSVESPFDVLDIEWRFETAPEGCRIGFAARARLSDSLPARLLQPWLDRLTEFVPAAFVKRARFLYGPR
jgi:coenzyme Q-binding protein COQ10